MTPPDRSTIHDSEIAVIEQLIPRLRAFTTTPLSASMVALAMPAIHMRDRIADVLDEMEARGLLERVDERFDHIVGEPRYREISAASDEEDGA